MHYKVPLNILLRSTRRNLGIKLLGKRHPDYNSIVRITELWLQDYILDNSMDLTREYQSENCMKY